MLKSCEIVPRASFKILTLISNRAEDSIVQEICEFCKITPKRLGLDPTNVLTADINMGLMSQSRMFLDGLTYCICQICVF